LLVDCFWNDAGRVCGRFCGQESKGIRNLKPDVYKGIYRVCSLYFSKFQKPVMITSGWRSLRQTAEIMALLSVSQLKGMYCRHGCPDYIRSIVLKREVLGTVLSEDDVYSILQNRKEGYISRHLFGAAVDLSCEDMKLDELNLMLKQCGFSVFNEQALGVECLHASYSAEAPVIIRI